MLFKYPNQVVSRKAFVLTRQDSGLSNLIQIASMILHVKNGTQQNRNTPGTREEKDEKMRRKTFENRKMLEKLKEMVSTRGERERKMSFGKKDLGLKNRGFLLLLILFLSHSHSSYSFFLIIVHLLHRLVARPSHRKAWALISTPTDNKIQFSSRQKNSLSRWTEDLQLLFFLPSFLSPSLFLIPIFFLSLFLLSIPFCYT